MLFVCPTIRVRFAQLRLSAVLLLHGADEVIEVVLPFSKNHLLQVCHVAFLFLLKFILGRLCLSLLVCHQLNFAFGCLVCLILWEVSGCDLLVEERNEPGEVLIARTHDKLENLGHVTLHLFVELCQVILLLCRALVGLCERLVVRLGDLRVHRPVIVVRFEPFVRAEGVAVVPVFIVSFPLFLIAEDLIGFLQLLEVFSG